VLRIIAQWIDRCAIKAAAKTVCEGFGSSANARAAELLEDPRFFKDLSETVPSLRFSKENDFKFDSQAPLGLKSNDLVRGKFFREKDAVPPRAAVLLVHGWNAEAQYELGFPRLARRLINRGLGAAMIELPFHSQRRPTEPGAARNFICDDLVLMLKATRQCLQDLQSTALWLKSRGYDQVFIWGFSLGAWLAGLLCCFSRALDGIVLVTPIARMDLAIQELAFCSPIRKAFREHPLDVTPLNLTAYKPLIAKENILIVQSEHDLFAGAESLEELCLRWGEPERWKVKHGHISILLSGKQMGRISDWIRGKVK
jgi:pimeloyl-ACP methyl ester carboxylesterase